MGSGFEDAGRPGLAKAADDGKARKRRGEPAAVDPGAALAKELEKSGAEDDAARVEKRVKELEAKEEAQAVALREEAAELKAKGFYFKHAQADDKTVLRKDLGRVVETLWVEDMFAEWERLKSRLRLGPEKRTTYAHVNRALDDARQLAGEAFRLYATAKREKERWEAENDVVHAAMWNKATQRLQAEKDAGIRSKQITDADVKAMANTLFPDEYKAQEGRRREVQLTVDAIADLQKRAAQRADDLAVMLQKLRG